MKRYIIIIGVICLTCQMQAQQVRQSYINMPDSLSALLTKINREDFIDFLDSNMKAEVNNRLGGKTEMTRLTDDFIEVQSSSESTFQMKVLTKAVSTVCGPACDSHINFYTTDWQPLNIKDYLPKLPTMDSFLKPLPEDASYALRDAYRQVDMLLMKAELSPTDNSLTFTFTTSDYMEAEAAKQVEPYITPQVVLTWNNGKFD